MKPTARDGATAKQIFDAALRITDPVSRSAYLREACGDDRELTDRVEALLIVQELQSAELPVVPFQAAAGPRREPDSAAAVDEQAPRSAGETATSKHREKTSAASTRDPATDATPCLGPPIGPYQLLEKLGEGGMGAVYRARQTAPLRRDVALKVVKAGMDSDEVLARFAAERQTLALLEHPHIARMYDAGTTEQGRPYFAMELVAGVPIDEFCADNSLPTVDCLTLFVDACGAVQHAHRNGIIHRDVKPSNMLVTNDNGKPVVKVIDFGIAKALHSEPDAAGRQTRITQLLGTPAYMSPEQTVLGGLTIDTRSDVYSLGVLLYKLLTGTTPLDAEQLQDAGFDEVRRTIRDSDPTRPSSRLRAAAALSAATGAAPRPSSTTGRIRRELDWIVTKALEKDRDRRYGSVAEFADDIRRYLDHRPVEAGPPSLLYRTRKAMRRHWPAFLACGAVVIALLLTTGVSVWQVVMVRRAWRVSDERRRQAVEMLSAARYQKAFEATRRRDLLAVADGLRPLRRLSEPDPRFHPASATFLAFLENIAAPRSVWEFAGTDSILGLDTSTDGRRAVSVDAAGNVRLLDLTPKPTMRLLGSHHQAAVAVAVKPDGTRAVTGTASGEIWMWELNPTTPVKRNWFKRSALKSQTLKSLRWSPLGDHIAVTTNGEFLVTDETGGVLLRIANADQVSIPLFHPTGRRLIVPAGKSVEIWDIDSKTQRAEWPVAPLTDITALCWAGRQQQWLVAAGSSSETLTVLSHLGKRLGTVAVGRPAPTTLSSMPGGDWVLSMYSDGTIKLATVAEGISVPVISRVDLQFSAHREISGPCSAAWRPGSSAQFLTAANDGRLRLWSRFEVNPASIIQPPTPLHVANLSDSNQLVVYEEQTESEPPTTGQIRRASIITPPGFRPGGAALPFVASTFSDTSGRHFAVAAPGQVAVIAQHRNGETIAQLSSDVPQPRYVAISERGTLIVCGADRLCAWNSDDGWSTYRELGAWDFSVRSAPQFADGGRVAVLNTASGVIEFDLFTGTALHTHHLDSPRVRASRQGNLLAAGVGQRIRVWRRGAETPMLDAAAPSRPVDFAFSPDDTVLLSLHQDGVIRGWHVSTGQELGELFRSRISLGRPDSLQFSTDGLRLLARFRRAGGLWNLVLLGRDAPSR